MPQPASARRMNSFLYFFSRRWSRLRQVRSKRSLEASSPKCFRTRSSVDADCLVVAELVLDLADAVLGDLDLLRGELPEIAPAEELRVPRELGPEALLERLEVPLGHRQLGQPRVVRLGDQLRGLVAAVDVGREEDLGPGLLHVVDVLAENAAARVVDLEHVAVEVLVVRLDDDLQDDRALEVLDGLAADGQGLVVFLVDEVADLVPAVRVVLLDVLRPLAGRLLEGQLFGEDVGGEGVGRRLEIPFDESDVFRRHCGQVVRFAAHFLSFFPINRFRMTFWTWSRFSAWS